MRTPTLVLLLLGLILSGCSRSADPLDWKIEGRHIDELRGALDEITDHLAPELGREFAFCCANIKADALAGRQAESAGQRNDRICRRLRGKSVREILIEGNELAHQASATQLALQSEKLVRLLDVSDHQPEARRAYHAQSIDYTKKLIESLKRAQAKSGQRLAELRAPAAK